MPTIYMPEGEVARDFAAVLEKIRHGVEIIVEQNHRPVAIIRPMKRTGRLISECIASARAGGSRLTLDSGFAHDVEQGIEDRQEPWNPPSWE